MNNDKESIVSEKVFNDEGAVMIPKYIFDLEMARGERHTKRWFIAFFVVLAMLFVTNAGWVIYENSFQDIVTTESYEAQADENSTALLNAGEGDINFYGSEGTGNKSNEDQSP